MSSFLELTLMYLVAANEVRATKAETFFKALFSQQPDKDNVITLDLDPGICSVMQVIPMDAKKSRVFCFGNKL